MLLQWSKQAWPCGWALWVGVGPSHTLLPVASALSTSPKLYLRCVSLIEASQIIPQMAIKRSSAVGGCWEG